jgi:hypothetical protein
MSGAIPLLPQYAFMAWCLVKKKKHMWDFELSGSEHSQINVLLMFLLLFPKMKMFASRKLL